MHSVCHVNNFCYWDDSWDQNCNDWNKHQHRCSKNVMTKMKISPKCKNQNCILVSLFFIGKSQYVFWHSLLRWWLKFLTKYHTIHFWKPWLHIFVFVKNHKLKTLKSTRRTLCFSIASFSLPLQSLSPSIQHFHSLYNFLFSINVMELISLHTSTNFYLLFQVLMVGTAKSASTQKVHTTPQS